MTVEIYQQNAHFQFYCFCSQIGTSTEMAIRYFRQAQIHPRYNDTAYANHSADANAREFFTRTK